jgi:hypothetical protein
MVKFTKWYHFMLYEPKSITFEQVFYNSSKSLIWSQLIVFFTMGPIYPDDVTYPLSIRGN